jgi:predicted ester cyclase
MMSNAETSRRVLEESFNQGRLSVIDEIAVEGYANHDPSDGGEYVGREAAKRQIEMYRKAFPDLQLTVDDLIEAGNKVVIRWTGRGTHRGELMDLAPTGMRTTTTGITIDRYDADGKLVESWTNWDTLGLLRQLGAAPVHGSVAEKIGIQLQHLAARRHRMRSSV